MASIRLENLRKRFHEHDAVKSLSLEIPDGAFAALLGPSGCGKTTTMRMIAGLETPTSGAIYFDQRLMNEIPAGKRGLGFVFQNYAIFTHMTAYDNIAFGLKIHNRPQAEIDAEVHAVADLLQMSHLLQYNAGHLSVNDMQKVAIARSMITKPAIFLLDEPFSNLDASFRAYMRAELKRIQRETRQTMIYVTHDQIEAMSMADYIAVMDFGVLKQFGTPYDIYNHPANTFVAGFIGSPNMNFINCAYRLEDGRPWLIQKEGLARLPLSDEQRSVVEQVPDGEHLILGIRPEHIRIQSEPGAEGTWSGVVYVIEPLGAKTIVHMKVGEALLRVTAPADYNAALGDTQWLKPNPNYIHVFEGQSGEALRVGTQA